MQARITNDLARRGLGKDRRDMKTRDKVYDAAENIKPYVERAMEDEKLRDDVMRAFGSAREIYKDLMGEKSAVTLASRVATDDDIRDKLRDAIEDLRHASERLQGKEKHAGRNTTLLVAGIALGLLFNPITGPETRRFIKEMLTSGDESGRSTDGSNGRG
jgi:gas vesicle protein